MLSKIIIIAGILICSFWLVCFIIAAMRVYKKRKADENQKGLPAEKIKIEDQVIAILNRGNGSKEVIKDE
jgi:hypothetical protein